MGAWGSEVFSNDVSEDWLDMFLEEPTRGRISETFEELRESGTDNADACCEALAAAEVVAALNGKPGANLPEELTEWLARREFAPSKTMVNQAGSAVSKVLRGSELAELCDGDEAWEASVEDLLRRLGRVPKPKPTSSSFRVAGLYSRLKKVTARAGFAFGLRCVMRVRPLIVRCAAIESEEKQWMHELVIVLTDVVAGGCERMSYISLGPDGRTEGYGRVFQNENAAEAGGDLAAKCACASLRVMLAGVDSVLHPREYVSDSPQQAAQSAKVAAEFTDVRTLKPLASDFRYLEANHPRPSGEDHALGEPIDVSESGPMGPLWGKSPPDWFTDAS